MNLLMSFFCSTSKHGQVVYQGAVREFEEVTKSLDSIGPEVIQTLSVSTIHGLLCHCIKSHSIMKCVLFRSLFVNPLQLDEPIRADKLTLGGVTRLPALFIGLMFPALGTSSTFSRACYQLHLFHPNVIFQFMLFQIRNKGPSAVDGSVVTVNFPARYQSSKPESYLLYLLQVGVSVCPTLSCITQFFGALCCVTHS